MELRLASEDEKRARDRLTFAEWGPLLTLEQFLDREQRLRAHPWSRAGMRTWLLVEGDEVLASCETFAMPGDVDGVASVFVAPELRGKGHASQLMTRLVERLRSEGRLATLLFSDVGPELYERAGFVLRPALERHFAPQPGDPRNACDRLFSENDFAQELAAAPRPDDALLIWPDAAQLDWHLERERIYTELLGRRRPSAHGAAAGSARAFWQFDVRHDELKILLLAARSGDEARAVIQAAQRMAHEVGAKRVVLWECAWPFELKDGALTRRTESLPMICPLREGVDPRGWGNTCRALWI